MKTRWIAFLLAAVLCLTFSVPVFAEDADSSETDVSETSESGSEASASEVSFELPTPTIEEAYLDKDDEGYTIIVVRSTPHEDLAAIDAYLAENKSYAIGVEFYVNINNEGFVKVASRGEKASEGLYSCDLPASYSGKYYKSAESYFQIQMRYVYDYDWIRVTQSEWSNTLEINSELSGIDLQQKADAAGTVTTLLWIGGIVLLIVLLCVVLTGGDRRCPDCRGRVSKKTPICPRCGYNFKTKTSGAPKPSEAVPAEESTSENSSEQPEAEKDSDTSK